MVKGKDLSRFAAQHYGTESFPGCTDAIAFAGTVQFLIHDFELPERGMPGVVAISRRNNRRETLSSNSSRLFDGVIPSPVVQRMKIVVQKSLTIHAPTVFPVVARIRERETHVVPQQQLGHTADS